MACTEAMALILPSSLSAIFLRKVMFPRADSAIGGAGGTSRKADEFVDQANLDLLPRHGTRQRMIDRPEALLGMVATSFELSSNPGCHVGLSSRTTRLARGVWYHVGTRLANCHLVQSMYT